MQTDRGDLYLLECVMDSPSPASFGSGPGGTSNESDLRMDEYLLRCTQRLDVITERGRRGETMERDSRDWMLAQADFLAETLGNDSLELDETMRSNLLQFLMAIANLNEQIRHGAAGTT